MNERSAETIIADWLMGFSGSDTIEEHRQEAQEVIRWLRDEEWDLIRREHLAVLVAIAEAARAFADERAKLSRPIDEPNHTERAWLALLNALSAFKDACKY